MYVYMYRERDIEREIDMTQAQRRAHMHVLRTMPIITDAAVTTTLVAMAIGKMGAVERQVPL